MRRTPVALFVMSMLVPILASRTEIFAADQWLGTWKLNLAKSKYDPPELAPKSQLVKREPWDGGVKTTFEGIDAQDKPFRIEYMAKFDGQDYPWTGQVNADTVSLKRGDDHYYQEIWRLGGKATIGNFTVVSRDDKTLTTLQTGRDAEGRVIRHLAVYDRQ